MAKIPSQRRRQTLALIGAGAAAPQLLAATPPKPARPGTAPVAAPPAPAPHGPVRTDVVTVLYRKEQPDAPPRSDAIVQAATLALENEFLKQGLKLVQPDAKTYALLDQGPTMVVTFAADAGFSFVFSLSRSVRPMPSSDMAMADVRLSARVFVGRSILAAETGNGRMAANLGGGAREFGERRAQEQAAERAAADLVGKVARQLKSLDANQIQAMVMGLPAGTAVAGGQALPSAAPAAAPAVQVQSTLAAGQAALEAEGALPPPARRFALVVGVADYGPVRARLRPQMEPGDLPGVAQDVRTMVGSLQKMGFEAGNIGMLLDGQATSAALRQQLTALAGRVQEDDLVLIAISAHGAPKEFGPSGFGLPVLSDFAGPSDANALDFWQLQSLVGNLPARRIVLVVDTCHAGGVAKLMPSAVVSSRGVSVRSGTVVPEPDQLTRAMQFNPTQANRHFAVLAASQPEELSLEAKPNGGLFTSHLMRGLAAAGGQKTLEAVFREQVQQQVMQASTQICQRLGECKVQTPVFAYSGRGNLIRV